MAPPPWSPWLPEAAFVHSSSPRSQRRASSVHSSPYPQALRRHHCPRLVAALKSSTPKLHSLIAAPNRMWPVVQSNSIFDLYQHQPSLLASRRADITAYPLSSSLYLHSSNPLILQSSIKRGHPPTPSLAAMAGRLLADRSPAKCRHPTAKT